MGRKRVARIMRQRGLIRRCKRKWTKTTDPDPAAAAVDLPKRAFGPGTVEIDRVYVGDITYVSTWEGWLYLATVIDLSSRRVVGWAMAEHMRAELVCDAMAMAIDVRRPAPGLIFHSDRGASPISCVETSPARIARLDSYLGTRIPRYSAPTSTGTGPSRWSTPPSQIEPVEGDDGNDDVRCFDHQAHRPEGVAPVTDVAGVTGNAD